MANTQQSANTKRPHTKQQLAKKTQTNREITVTP